jgi:hypothetical protein
MMTGSGPMGQISCPRWKAARVARDAAVLIMLGSLNLRVKDAANALGVAHECIVVARERCGGSTKRARLVRQVAWDAWHELERESVDFALRPLLTPEPSRAPSGKWPKALIAALRREPDRAFTAAEAARAAGFEDLQNIAAQMRRLAERGLIERIAAGGSGNWHSPKWRYRAMRQEHAA